MRAKVTEKPYMKADFYGKVGTVIYQQHRNGVKLVTLKFNDGQIQTFGEGDLRMDVRDSGN